jgi:FkbM family methyltransferase
MAYLSFTRNREDVLIVRALGHIQNGFYVDVGAFQPVVDSNTYALYLRGWQGVAVEPQRQLHPMWAETRPRDTVVGSAIGAISGETRFFEFAGWDQNATTDSRVADMHESAGAMVNSAVVPQVALTDLLAEHRPVGDIHLLSVDVEGAEKAVLEGLDLSRFRPWLMILESTVPNRFEENFAEWESLVLGRGYQFAYYDAVNRFYVADEHADLLRHFSYPPCVWDDFVDHRLHLAQQAELAARMEAADLRAQLLFRDQ